jgi:hypothetical protein
MQQLSTPVAFLVFNRPHTTARVWSAIREARPATLLVVADGPRAGRDGEAARCTEVRAICDNVDWPCQVLRNYADSNLGCRQRVSSGLDWVFETVEEAIILEDDCLPHPTFFTYCQELLERYRDDERVMLISGDNFQPGPPRTPYSYYFSRYPHIWGWASWRRAWRHYDVNMSLWPTIRDAELLTDLFDDARSVEYWEAILPRVANREIDTWDYQVTFALRCQYGLSVLPRVNLVTNIGFGPEATHTTYQDNIANLKAFPIDLPLSHPPFVIVDSRADSFTERRFYSKGALHARIIHMTKALLRRVLPFSIRHSNSDDSN